MAEKECIDREAAYRFFKDQLEEETGAYSKGRNAGLRVAMSAVMNKDAIPAADARPVRRGKWRLYSPLTDTYECDRCGYQVIDESFRTNFCPNCGAVMEES